MSNALGTQALGELGAATTRRGTDHRPTALIASAAFSCLVVTLLQSLVVPAIPQLPAIFGASAASVSWLVTVTLLTGAIATPIFGRLSDLFPRRSMMVLTMGLVLVGSVLAPLGGMPTVMLGRGLQGIGTALIPIAMAEMRHSLPRGRVPGALALLSAMLGIGGGLGIPLGGILLSWLGWAALFWFASAMSLISVILLLTFIPNSPAEASGRFDVPGALLLSVGLSAVLTSISQGDAWGWASSLTIGTFVAGIGIFTVWAAVETRHSSPLVNLRTSAQRPILLTNLAAILLGLLMFTNLLLTTLELQNPGSQAGFGWEAQSAGLAMLPSVAAMCVVAPAGARIASRHGARAVVTTGCAITALGYAGRLIAEPSGAAVIIWATVIAFGVALGYAGMPMIIMQHVPQAETGSANGVNALMRSIGMAGSSAMVAAITVSMSVSSGGHAIPSASALTVIALIGTGSAILATLLAHAARN